MSESKDTLTLYGIGDEFRQLDEILEDSVGEITKEADDQEKMILDFLLSKVDNCAGYDQYLEDLIENTAAQIKRLVAFKEGKQKRLDNFREYVKLCLIRSNRESFEGKFYQVSIRKPSPKLEIKDDSKVPPEFISSEKVTVVKIDSKGLLKALKTGRVEQVDGMRLVDSKSTASFKLKSNNRKREKSNETESESESESVSDSAASI